MECHSVQKRHVILDNMFGGVSSNKEMFISLLTSTEETVLKSVSIYIYVNE